MTPQETMHLTLAIMATFLGLVALCHTVIGIRNKVAQWKIAMMGILSVGFITYAATMATI